MIRIEVVFWSRASSVPLVRHNCSQLWSLECSLVEASLPCTLRIGQHEQDFKIAS